MEKRRVEVDKHTHSLLTGRLNKKIVDAQFKQNDLIELNANALMYVLPSNATR
jgi:hypothetical protein